MIAMEKWDDEEAEILSLCKDVVCSSKNSDYCEFSNSISILRDRCGKKECDCLNYTPYQSLRLLLRAGLDETLIDYSVGLSLINNYSTVGSEAQCQAVLQQLVKRSLSESCSAARDSFLDQVWNCQGLKTLNIDVINELLGFHTKIVEEEIFAVFDKALKDNYSPWEDSRFEKYVLWSSKSAKIFSTVSSLLNSCLLRIVSGTSQYQYCVRVVKQFVDKVKTECIENKQDFVLLYPYEYHSLILLLDVPPEFYPETPVNEGSVGLETVSNLVKQNLKMKPVQTLCILTHFPDWVSYIRH